MRVDLNTTNQKNIETTGAAVAAMMQDMTGQVGASSFPGTEEYRPAKVSKTGSVDMSQATYLRPNGKEETMMDALAEETGKSAMARRNEMAVLANTTSSEDLAKAAEDGYDLSDMDSHTIVTVLDKIKANMAKMGVDISAMGGLSKDELAEITGSEALAQQITASLRVADLPTTEENVVESKEAVEEAMSLSTLDESALTYLLRNDLAPSIGNLYKAEHSATENAGSAIEEEAFSQLRGSIEETLAKAGMLPSEEKLDEAKWMLENQVPVTPKNLTYLEELKNLSLDLENGLDVTAILSTITKAITEGSRPADGMLVDGYSMKDLARHYVDVLTSATEEDLAYLIEKGEKITLAGLEEAQNLRKVGRIVVEPKNQELALVTAKRQLEEARLVMTAEANLSLMKRGVAIDTKPIEQLVEDLKAKEQDLAKEMFAGAKVEATEARLSIFTETTGYLEELKHSPAKILNLAEDLDTLRELHTAGEASKRAYAAAGEKYEELMTSPRADLGDSIKKAFRNVDDILTDLGLSTSEENRRAVRILAYNETALTEENIALMKAKDAEVQRVFANLTPNTVLEMIRRNENPLDMPLTQLNALARQIEEETGRHEERFSKFLYDLDQKKAITKEERQAYIGIYRLFAQVEKTDGAAIGALVNQGAELTMRNLLAAVRSQKKAGMDYQVDEQFAGVEGSVKTEKIDEQILSAYHANLVNEALEELSATGIAHAMKEGWEDTTVEEFVSKLVEEAPEENGYYDEKLAQFEQAVQARDEIYETLSRLDFSNSVENVLAAELYMQRPNELFTRLFQTTPGATEEKLRKVRAMKEEVLERFGEAVKTPEEMAQALDELGDLAEHAMETMIIEDPDATSVDLEELRMLNKALFFGKAQAREENYVIPMETSDGVVTGISLKIIRGQEKKGFVDLMLRDSIMGKIAASFEAKNDRISGMIAVDDEESRRLLSDNLPSLVQLFNDMGEDSVDLHVAYVKDLSLETFGAASNLRKEQQEGEDTEARKQNHVQTARLYGIAECFINAMKEYGTGSIWY